ncbi:hypothetical protein WMY93_013593 [Mugilogobius chulae]|uniref:Constitutive coactivator of peroxisome proliferator-activated receptor gamma n=1 Tax=Mugilogobius chulae TaxID=88201 RepID=A0AAW0P9L0_9GOBI
MAKQHSANNQNSPTLVVDGMACLRHWYSCKDWVSGGQWKEYIDILKRWVEAFTSAGIKLVFYFDGVVEEQKRLSWIKRRRRVNSDVRKIFTHIKTYGEEPGREFFVLPSGLATFTSFALNYAREHNCMGILGQDTDFIIFDSAPYLSFAKLKVGDLSTVLYDRRRLCHTLGLADFHLPLLACLLGNDVVSEERMQHIRKDALAKYRQFNSTPYPGPQQGELIFAVSQFVRSCLKSHRDLISPSLKLSPADKELLERACREKHVGAEGFLVYSVVSEGVIECSNSLEDEDDTELLPQALVYRPCRQRIYGLLLLHDADGNPPAIKEWFVYPGNPLKEAEMIHPSPLKMQCDHPGLDVLWFSKEPEVSSLRQTCFLVQTLSQEDVDAYLSQAVCLAQKSSQQLQQIKLPIFFSRVVQMGCLYVRGLSYLLGANCACGCPLNTDALMPWNSFDGRLFHSKYYLAHSGVEDSVLLDNNASCLNVFHRLKTKVKEVCLKKGRELLSNPRSHTPQFHLKTRVDPHHREHHTGNEGFVNQSYPHHYNAERWRGRGEARRENRHFRGNYPSTSQYSDFYSHQYHSRGAPTNRRDSRGRFHHRGRYQLAPRWSQPPAP